MVVYDLHRRPTIEVVVPAGRLSRHTDVGWPLARRYISPVPSGAGIISLFLSAGRKRPA
jgi:hypothetical protein